MKRKVHTQIRTRCAVCWIPMVAIAVLCGCKTFDSTEADLERERERHRELMEGKTPHDATDPGVFSRPRN